MLNIKNLENFPAKLTGGVLSIGNFDGVHLGHKALLNRAKSKAIELGQASCLLSFSPHPVKVLHPDKAFKELFPLQDMVEQVELLGFDALIIQEFDLEFSRKTPKEFVSQIYEYVKPSHIVVGDDFHFGADRSGDFHDLQLLGEKYGFTVEQISPVDLGGLRMSSSLIRTCLSTGDVRAASEYLGRPFELRGKVVGGEKRGRRLGFPTANIEPENEIIPKVGVYVTELEVSGQSHPSLTNIGYRPTFEGQTDSQRLSIESYVLREDFDIYGDQVRLKFLERVRPELKFSSSDELIKQIEQDVHFAESYFAKNK